MRFNISGIVAESRAFKFGCGQNQAYKIVRIKGSTAPSL